MKKIKVNGRGTTFLSGLSKVINLPLFNFGENVFFHTSSLHYVQYVEAPTLEAATAIANHIKIYFWRFFPKKTSYDGWEYPLLLPRIVSQNKEN